MSDIVKRLRGKRERCHDLSGVYYTEDMDCQEAADYIEKLEAQLAAADELAAALGKTCYCVDHTGTVTLLAKDGMMPVNDALYAYRKARK